MSEPINLAGRRERAPQPADGPPAITFTMDDDRIIFRDQAALDDYLSGAIIEATETIERERATWAAAWSLLAADDTAALNAARAEAWDEGYRESMVAHGHIPPGSDPMCFGSPSHGSHANPYRARLVPAEEES